MFLWTMISRQDLVGEPCVTALVRGKSCQFVSVLQANILAKMRMGEQQSRRASEAHILTENWETCEPAPKIWKMASVQQINAWKLHDALTAECAPQFLSGFFMGWLRPLQLLVLAQISFDPQHHRFPYEQRFFYRHKDLSGGWHWSLWM